MRHLVIAICRAADHGPIVAKHLRAIFETMGASNWRELAAFEVPLPNDFY